MYVYLNEQRTKKQVSNIELLFGISPAKEGKEITKPVFGDQAPYRSSIEKKTDENGPFLQTKQNSQISGTRSRKSRYLFRKVFCHASESRIWNTR